MNIENSMTKYYNPERGPDKRKRGRKKGGVLPPGEASSWSVSEAWEIHHEITRLLLLGFKNVEIAERLNISPQMVSNTRNSPIIQDKLALMRKARDIDIIDVSKSIKEFAPVALKLLKDVVSGEDEGIGASLALRVKTGESFLDRAGHGAINKVQAAVAYLTKEDIDEMKEKAFGKKEPAPGPTSEVV